MLSDFLLIETYYDAPETARAYEDLTKEYGVDKLKKALSAGYVACGRMKCGAQQSRHLFWLTDKGRQAAQSSNSL